MTRSVSPAAPVGVVIMGVAGSGKTTTARNLSRALGWAYRDADEFHPPENIAKMSRGEPLTDEDRWPWLRAIAAWLAERLAAGESVIVTCSALKRAYRDILAAGRPDVRLVLLAGDRDLIGARMKARKHHFMPTSLLDSQFAALEPPGPDEGVVTVSVVQSPRAVVHDIIACLGLDAAG
ncbi:gluconokinase [Alsobacter sp. KACC 23698]|uniref:Gluconokinase n=1 Tax=Alsobacter sp. KACC 23698 TaxID=3149229 RepID=A0AAU7JM39_9HYPH